VLIREISINYDEDKLRLNFNIALRNEGQVPAETKYVYKFLPFTTRNDIISMGNQISQVHPIIGPAVERGSVSVVRIAEDIDTNKLKESKDGYACFGKIWTTDLFGDIKILEFRRRIYWRAVDDHIADEPL
jgi:hypothetical protein